MLIVHLFVSYAHVNLCHIFSFSWCRGWLRLLLVALLGFSVYLFEDEMHFILKCVKLDEEREFMFTQIDM